MSSDTPSDDDSNEEWHTPFSDGVRRAMQLVEHAENRIAEYRDDLVYYRSLRFPRLYERLTQNKEPDVDIPVGYDPVRPQKLTVTTCDGSIQTTAAWMLCDAVLDDRPTKLYVDANSKTCQAYIARQEYDGDTALPVPFVPEDLANYDLDQVAHLVKELKRQGEELVLMAAQVGEG